MNINLWRKGIHKWLDSYLLVDSWELRNPTSYEKVNAFIPPLQAISFQNNQIEQVSATQDFYLTIRYRGEYTYDSLPIGKYEQLYTDIVRRLQLNYKSIADLLDLQVLTVDNPIQVSEYGDDSTGDWLVVLVFKMGIVWLPEPTLLPGDLPVVLLQPVKLDVGLFTEHLRSTDHLDASQRDKFGKMSITAPPS